MSGFTFQQFTVCHDLCAMKVGTDGVLLGAWARVGERCLDVGTGSGLIALMLAQRGTGARVTAIDIDHDACRQATSNFASSPFAERLLVCETSLQNFSAPSAPFDCIVSNPPFFASSLHSPDAQRTLARHGDTLTARDLMRCSARLLAPGGTLSIIIPYDLLSLYDTEASVAGLFSSRRTLLRTVPRKPVRRILLEYTKLPATLVTEEQLLKNPDGTISAWYSALTRDFYLHG